jgi:hypothetical protein
MAPSHYVKRLLQRLEKLGRVSCSRHRRYGRVSARGIVLVIGWQSADAPMAKTLQ